MCLRVQVGGSAAAFSDGSLYSSAGNFPDNSVTTEVSRAGSAGTETNGVRENVPVTSSRMRFLRLKASRL